MFKFVIGLIGLAIIVGGILLAWYGYSALNNRRAERIARMQERAAEITVTTIEGWTIDDIAEAIEKSGLGSADDFKTAVNNFDSTQYSLLVKPAKTDLEGYLFPDTYRFAKADTLDEVVEKMIANFTDRLATLNVTAYSENISIPGYSGLSVSGGDSKPGISLYDVITLASIIEKESGGKGSGSGADLSLNEERRLVASVFYNRLKIGQALESDATVNYVTGKNSPGASSEDLQVNSPYNTYKYPGLPPGPICNPSLGSIAAALNPAVSDYYYFLHKQPSGKVEFSKTFDEHVKKKLE